MTDIYADKYRSPFGWFVLLSTAKGLCYLGLPTAKQTDMNRFLSKYFGDIQVEETGGKINSQAKKELGEYFKGERRIFTIPLDLRVSGFYRRALLAVKRIPYGKTRTYGQIASSLGNRNASRAVGGANVSNPIPIIIPCHRVLASNGLGGYGGGLSMKKKLLDLEAKVASHQK